MTKIFTIRDSILIEAPIERCFALSTSVEVVAVTLEMRPAEGRLGGMIVAEDRLLWRGWKFGLPQMHETLITGFKPPEGGAAGFFQDTMGRGRFARFQHDHHFQQTQAGTLLEDELRFSMPLGWAGALVGRWLMVPYIQGVMGRRFRLLKKLAEGDGWREYLGEVQGKTLG